MELSNLAPLAFLAPLALFWNQARGFMVQIFSFLIRTDRVDGMDSMFVMSYCNQKFKQVSWGNLTYLSNMLYHAEHSRWLPFLFVLRGKYIFLHKRFIPIVVTPNFRVGASFTYLNIFNFSKIMYEILEHARAKEIEMSQYYSDLNRRNGFGVRTHSGSSIKGMSLLNKDSAGNTARAEPQPSPSSGQMDSGSLWTSNVEMVWKNTIPLLGDDPDIALGGSLATDRSKYYFSEKANELLELVSAWRGAGEWYAERDIRYYMGILLAGPPGQGKSSLVLEIAKKLGMTVHIFNLNTFDDQELEQAFDIHLHSGSIVLFEDLDRMKFRSVDADHNTLAGGNGISLEYLLNKMSGSNALRNAIVFVTANNKEALPPALIRKGRIDHVIELGPICMEGKKFIAGRMLNEWPELIESVVTDKPETAAEFEAHCTSVALEAFWKSRKK